MQIFQSIKIPTMNIYLETSEEVVNETKEFLSSGLSTREKMMFEGIDVSRFKDDVDPKLINKFLIWVAEGFTNSMQNELKIDEIDKFTEELYQCLDLMKKYFYKE